MRQHLPTIGDRVRINTGVGLFHGNQGVITGVRDDALDVLLAGDEDSFSFKRGVVELDTETQPRRRRQESSE